MVKRKSSFDRLEKAIRAPKTNRKPKRGVTLEALFPVVDGDTLVIKRADEVYFERLKESRPILCVGTVIQVYDERTNPRCRGVVEIWDETHEECWAFNWKKDLHLVKVGILEDRRAKAAPVVEETSAPAESVVHVEETVPDVVPVGERDGDRLEPAGDVRVEPDHVRADVLGVLPQQVPAAVVPARAVPGVSRWVRRSVSGD